MTISEVAKKFGISTDTLRYYERIGLIPPVKKNKSGRREYTELDCGWVEFTMKMKKAGLSLESLIEYIALWRQGESTEAARKAILFDEREKLEQRIAEDQATLEILNAKIDYYDERLVPAVNRQLGEK